MVSIFNIPLNFTKTSFSAKKVLQKTNTQSVFENQNITNPIRRNLGTKAEIEANAMTNSKIRKILEDYDLPLTANVEELERLIQGHLNDTKIVVTKIYLTLPQELKEKINLQELQEAATLHDYGKVLIPESILNKKGKLTEKEFEIMQKHSEIGYELLKNKGYSQNILNLIKYHHQNPTGKGYPKLENYNYGIESEILNIADKYTALREKRSYKNPLGKYEALEIIAKEVNKGEISQEVYTALIKSV